MVGEWDGMGWAEKKKVGINWTGTWLRSFPAGVDGVQELPMMASRKVPTADSQPSTEPVSCGPAHQLV